MPTKKQNLLLFNAIKKRWPNTGRTFRQERYPTQCREDAKMVRDAYSKEGWFIVGVWPQPDTTFVVEAFRPFEGRIPRF